MKSLTRTIIVLAVLNLAMGSFALAQAESQSEPAASRRGRGSTSPETTVVEPTQAEPSIRTFIISGKTGLSGVVIKGLSGVVMQGLPGDPVTDENGYYRAEVDYGWSGTVTPTKKGFTFSPSRQHYTPVTSDQTNRNYISQRVGPAPMLGRTGGRKVLVIPDSDVEPEDLDALTQDLLVMSHILDERFKESRTIKGVFTDFGEFFGRNNRSTEAIYMQGYGVIFLMEVNFAFSPPLKPEEQEDEETAEQVDPTWQRAREQIFSPQTPRPGMPGFSGQGPGLVEFDQLKGELIETLKHAANIRNLTPDEWIIVTVIGQGRQPGEFYEDYYRSATPGTGTSRSRGRTSLSSGGGLYGGGVGMGGGIGGMAGGGGGGYGTSGRMGGMMGGMAGGGYGGMGGGMGGYGGGMGGFGGGMMGGMEYGDGMEYGEMGSASTTVLTIRAKKTDVDDFARGELDFEEFQQRVEIFTY
ncbi:MAG TPA: hypothetical protein VMW72_16160 [Sedimentisphaerales bacterium]|nr:hypothetical protein [Sedimentisphaerales bacterium]